MTFLRGVQVHSTRIIQAADPCRVHALGSSVPLGPLDSSVAIAWPVSVVFVYPVRIDVERLSIGLSGLLNHYPHLTGRLHSDAFDNRSIDRLGTGADLVLAISDQLLEGMKDEQGRVDPILLPGTGNDLLPTFNSATYANNPLLSVQCTSFPDGSALGVRIVHSVCDGDGFFQLVGNLAQIYTDGCVLTEPVIQSFSPSLPDYRREASTPFVSRLHSVTDGCYTKPGSMDTKNLVIGRYIHWSAAQLQALKERATHVGRRISTYTALVAHVYQAVHRARCALGGSIELSGDLLTAVNVRSKTPCLPPNYFPNAFLVAVSTYDPTDLVHADIRDVALFVNALVRDRVLPDEIDDTIRWMQAQPDKNRITNGFRLGTGGFIATQWSSFMRYEEYALDGVRPMLVIPPHSPISTLDGLLQTLAPVPTEEGGQEGLLIALSLSARVWDVIDRDRSLDM